MKAINIMVKEELYEEVKKQAQKQGKTLAQFVREALQEKIQGGNIDDNNITTKTILQEIKVLKKRLSLLEEKMPTVQRTEIMHTRQQVIGKEKEETTAKREELRRQPQQVQARQQHPPKAYQQTTFYPKGRYEKLIIQIMKTNPNTQWHWKQVVNKLIEKGVTEINPLSLKDRMNRMSKKGQLIKIDSGIYKLIE